MDTWRVDGLTLQGKNAEDGLVDVVEGSAGNETVRCLDAKGGLTQGKRPPKR